MFLRYLSVLFKMGHPVRFPLSISSLRSIHYIFSIEKKKKNRLLITEESPAFYYLPPGIGVYIHIYSRNCIISIVSSSYFFFSPPSPPSFSLLTRRNSRKRIERNERQWRLHPRIAARVFYIARLSIDIYLYTRRVDFHYPSPSYILYIYTYIRRLGTGYSRIAHSAFGLRSLYAERFLFSPPVRRINVRGDSFGIFTPPPYNIVRNFI